MTYLPLQGLAPDATGDFDSADLGKVTEQLRQQVKAFLGVPT
jgi:hypothetical protein